MILPLLALFSFGYGLIVGRFKIFPYEQARHVYEKIDLVRTVVSTASEASVSDKSIRLVETNLYNLEIQTYNNLNKFGLAGHGGAIVLINDRLVGADQRGRFFIYGKGGSFQPLNIELSMNAGPFEHFVDDNIRNGLVRREAKNFFRILDLAKLSNGPGGQLLVAHSYWNVEKETKTTRISALRVNDWSQLFTGATVPDSAWMTLYETTPPIRLGNNSPWAIRTNHNGCRMVVKDGALLVTFGDQRMDGVDLPEKSSQDDASSYGKLVRIDLETGETEMLAKGLRNPEGLLVDREGRIWETEHGPRGGDELNLLETGENYGWPQVTYGTRDGTFTWPLSAHQGRHDGYHKPIYSWVPSVGISNLIQIRDNPAAWDGDFLVSSLGGLTLYRLRIGEGRVIFAEPVRIGERIRDLEQLTDGTIVILADNGRFVEIKARDALLERTRKQLAFTDDEKALGVDIAITDCVTCHSFGRGESGVVAPPLGGVVGRSIASKNFPYYSAALKQQRGRWDRATLSRFLSDPQRFAPGTRMPDPGLKDDSLREAVVAFLVRQSGVDPPKP